MPERQLKPQTITFFERLANLESGPRARLKRNAGKSISEAQDTTLGLFYRLLPHGIPAHREEIYFLVATLYPLATEGGQGNLGDSLARVRQQSPFRAKGLDRRVEILLDADESQLPFRLRQTIRFLASHRIAVNWPYLLEDLLDWNRPRRTVQRNWARSYFNYS